MKESAIKDIVYKIVEDYNRAMYQDTNFPVEASARHVHLTKEAVEILFGRGESLRKKKDLSLPGFVAEQRVSIVTQKSEFRNVAVLGPERNAVQVEISKTDARALGLDPPVNCSGDLEGADDISIIGPKGVLFAQGSVIVAKAHVHMNPQEAETLGFIDNQTVSVRVNSSRPLVFDDIRIRVNEGMSMRMHIDLDEANACGLDNHTTGTIVAK